MAIGTSTKGTVGKVKDDSIGTTPRACDIVPSLTELGVDADTEDTIVGAIAIALSAVGLVAVGVLIGKAASALRK